MSANAKQAPVSADLDLSEAGENFVVPAVAVTDIAEYRPHEEQIVRLETSYAKLVVDCSTSEGLANAKEVRVDIRDVRELERDGVIPGAFHAPRGMLEFWACADSPYHKPVFAQDKRFVLFCAAGWRSALATKTLQDMGLPKVAHIDGGFGAWKAAGAPVEHKAPKPAKAGGGG